MTVEVDLFGLRVPLEAALIIFGESVIGSVLLVSVFLAAKHRGRRHHWMMLLAYSADEIAIKPLMYYRASLGVFGPFPFYHTMGFTHLILATSAGVIGIVAILVAFKYQMKSGTKTYLRVRGRPHRWLGAAYVAMWFVSLAFGLWIAHSLYSAS